MEAFSIIIPLYNKAAAIGGTITSVLEQDYYNFEVIIVDDGSTDSSPDIVNAFNDRRISYFRKENGGVSSARNFGLTKAKNDWILFLDGDDLLEKEALSTLQKMIIVFPGYKVYSGNMELYGGLRCRKFNEFARISKDPFKSWFMMDLAPEMGCFTFSREILKDISPFDVRLSFYEDLSFTAQLMEKFDFVYTSKVLKKYRKEYSTLSVACQPIEKEYAFYMSKESVKGTFWKEMVLAYNVWDTRRHHLEHGDIEGYKYYSKQLTLFHWYIQLYILGMSFKRYLGVLKRRLLQ